MNNLGIGSATIAKMGKGEMVSHNVINKICRYLDAEIDIFIHYGEKEDGHKD